MDGKLFYKSKTVWAAMATVVLSVVGIVVEAWTLLGPSDQTVLRDLFGPEAFGLLGIVMLVLRVWTSSALRVHQP